MSALGEYYRSTLSLDNGNLACEWRVQTYDCEGSEFFVPANYVSLYLNAGVIVLVLFRFCLLACIAPARLQVIRPGTRTINPVMALAITALVLSTAWIVRAAVILFGDDVHASVREILFVFPYICGAIGVNILMSAIVQAMPTFVWDHEAQKTQYLWVPSARQCFIALGIYTFFNFATLITTHVYLGYSVHVGDDPEHLSFLFQLFLNIGAAENFILLVPFSVFSMRFIIVMRRYIRSMETSNELSNQRSSLAQIVSHLTRWCMLISVDLVTVCAMIVIIANWRGAFTDYYASRVIFVLLFFTIPGLFAVREMGEMLLLPFLSKPGTPLHSSRDTKSSSGSGGHSPFKD